MLRAWRLPMLMLPPTATNKPLPEARPVRDSSLVERLLQSKPLEDENITPPDGASSG